MLRRNVDFFAMCFIALGLLAFSKLSAVRLPTLTQPIRFQNAMATDQCPVSTEVLSRLASLLEK
jgi:hypothetical protein